jgi:hypothetical protein
VRGVEHRRVLGAKAHEVAHVEEAAVVELAPGAAPVRQPPLLEVEQRLEAPAPGLALGERAERRVHVRAHAGARGGGPGEVVHRAPRRLDA